MLKEMTVVSDIVDVTWVKTKVKKSGASKQELLDV